MIDCFITTMAYDRLGLPNVKLRLKMMELCLERWHSVSGINPHVLFGEDREFQRDRRRIAESKARSQVYIVADDDCFPVFSDVSEVLELHQSYPEFAILSALPSNCTIYPWAEGSWDERVMEHVSVGGIRFCKRGKMKKWPEMTGTGYDAAQCEYLREHGHKVGYALNVKMNHLGEGFTTCT